jgi:hypothetical protein
VAPTPASGTEATFPIALAQTFEAAVMLALGVALTVCVTTVDVLALKLLWASGL